MSLPAEFVLQAARVRITTQWEHLGYSRKLFQNRKYKAEQKATSTGDQDRQRISCKSHGIDMVSEVRSHWSIAITHTEATSQTANWTVSRSLPILIV